MRLGDNRGTARFRTELKSWLDEHMPPGARAIDPSISSGHLPDWAREWQRTLFDAGWLMPRWPAGLGGRSAGPVEHMIYLEEMSRLGLTVPVILGGAALTRTYAEETLRAGRNPLPAFRESLSASAPSYPTEGVGLVPLATSRSLCRRARQGFEGAGAHVRRNGNR